MTVKVIYEFELDIPDAKNKEEAIRQARNINFQELQESSKYPVYIEDSSVLEVKLIEE